MPNHGPRQQFQTSAEKAVKATNPMMTGRMREGHSRIEVVGGTEMIPKICATQNGDENENGDSVHKVNVATENRRGVGVKWV